MTRVAVVGASGFIGGAVTCCLTERGFEVERIEAPRLQCSARTFGGVVEAAAEHAEVVQHLAERLHGSSLLVNCAGLATAGGSGDDLVGANALLPYLLRRASANVAARRFVHVSSSSVQGHAPVLTETPEWAPFSPYTQSKAWGERLLLTSERTVIYRPTSVHGADRAVTRSLAKIARSPLASVAGAGDEPSPQILVENVADAVCRLLLASAPVPRIVLHPSEGITAASVLTLLGGKPPRRVPKVVARGILSAAMPTARRPQHQAQLRRLEMMWFGQRQADSWLTSQGWVPKAGEVAWRELGEKLASRVSAPRGHGPRP